MVVNIVKSSFITILLLFFAGCYSSQQAVKDVFQTNSAMSIENDSSNIQRALKTFKQKLDMRNPNSYDKNLSRKIYTLLSGWDGNFLLKYKNTVLENYKDYLQLAFSKDDISSRNDYLVLGLYYMVHYAYDNNKDYKLTALQYDVKRLQKLYKNLQIIRWKIKVARDLDGKYLFLTWQNNWQIEMEKKYKGKYFTSKDIANLEYIKNKKESIYSPSNFSFEILLTQMIDSTANSLKALGEEPKDLGISALKMFIFL